MLGKILAGMIMGIAATAIICRTRYKFKYLNEKGLDIFVNT